MEFKTVNDWDPLLWDKVHPIYHQAFVKKGAKPEKIIRNMFWKQICFLHVAVEEEEVLAMALTGRMKGVKALLIDYLAVGENRRGKGIGRKFIEYLTFWAISEGGFDSLLIEVEAEATSENLARIQFWEKCGFALTNYIHHYIWVPEPYQAMYMKLLPDTQLPADGAVLFQYIGKFHKASFQGK